MHKIVIVGGGAGGLELATKLGDSLGKKKKAEITLIDCTKTHVWKPLLHEIAAGSMNPDKHELEYMAQAHWHHFRFRLGRMDRLNRHKKEVSIAPYIDEDGKEIIPRRSFQYDTLIISVGSTTNDFGIKGAAEHSIALDTQEQAEVFHQKLHHAILKAQTQKKAIQPGQLEVVIVGAGATGVELAAELHKATREMTAYGIDRVNPDRDIKISIIEASSRLLPALPKKLSHSVELELRKLRVHLYMGERVTSVSAKGVTTHTKRFVPSALVVWAAGVKAPDFLRKIDGLETNRINQLLVHTTLQTTRDDSIFAFGDCAACPIDGTDQFVPPRAQAAHQQASLLFKSMKMRVKGKVNLPQYIYKDYGSLVNMGEYSTVGNLMGSLMGGSMFIEGFIARLMYQSLYKMHLMALHGFMSTALQTLARIITRRTEAQVKLH
ncbi:NAD(P)/FAD-dependent oxidoreductase [Candidatus Methylopumilus universalis]|jgi:NADH dehydrogenase|uniref:NAD(P)/FAD-dependent oxidoreductase n=1 Tax=Candidatus Methylopumilus universalis TaxID=2588536 RepID=A0AAX1F0L5_9PROT|nr:NAD(P)/FAD-dependent oxidoreductase [Candidatus Methylopumilus universalis]QDC41516.1 NAD(P)/FAD-dependent oxidoreductase [Candidatus Methylopumilus universalis]QDC42797.1 NAD(P)/FAD-dependent oxidoreductase [Candidatus Methylopumilus universalis]QDC55186.1 NAD(P)/FAD-dependent oxidoreductase [Candidatus Methylopumilus universalis]QDC56465.1 NAD(P)/FAD-dependent oxidoreductase [Candidatus Methylopumilus universalis]QDC57756.1 NAD(P)/FAD-dependent oxidoreductase [Candidatus Methylopumilus un